MAAFPTPGMGYKIRSQLGGGAWKVAYRAASPTSLHDVALLYFHEEGRSAEFAKEVKRLLEVREHKHSGYVAEIKGFITGEDGRSFLIEELILRPLDALSPLRDLAKFVGIARDLCRGLTCLHEQALVHRDLKLDNCGLDRQNRAKLFDLGSVTSEPGDVEATILTRAPELFQRRRLKNFGSECDVWALGAMLFALRTGEYPFILTGEISERRGINKDLLAGNLTKRAAISRKSEIDERVKERVHSDDAESNLKERLHVFFRGTAEQIMLSMLEFNPENRPAAVECARQWNDLAIQLNTPVAQAAKSQEGIVSQVWRLIEIAESGDIMFSRNQIERLVHVYEKNKLELNSEQQSELENKFRKLKEFVG